MYCGRALCRDCAAEVQGKLSCQGTCEHEILRERSLFTRSEQALSGTGAYKITAGVYLLLSLFLVAFAMLAIVTGASLLANGQSYAEAVVAIVAGVICFVLAVGTYRASRGFKSFASQGPNESFKA